MATTTTPSVRAVEATAYQVPTATEQESDGTLVWDSTSVVVVEVRCGEHTGLGYTFCHPAAAEVIRSKLASAVEQADPLMPERTWAQMQVEIRQLGHAGIAAMAVSAVDVALWDLKAKLLGVCLADALPRFHDRIPIYGSGGFCNLTDEQLREQVRGWTDAGIGSVKIKVGRDKDDDPRRVEIVRDLAGPDVELMVDGNGAYTPQQALLWAERFREQGVLYFEEPVSSEDLEGLAYVTSRTAPGMVIAGGEYGWDLPYFHQMVGARAVHLLQADVTRCGGITNMLRVDALCKARGLPFSAHCAPAISAHVCCAMETARHIEYFFDHTRIESLLFKGTLDPVRGALEPDRTKLGIGLELDRESAHHYRV